MAQGKQAKVLSAEQQAILLKHVVERRGRHPVRDRVIVLLSYRAGLRAIEISRVTWSMVTDPIGEVSEVIALPNRASKGKGGGRDIPLHPELREALIELQAERGDKAAPHKPVVYTERGDRYLPAALAIWFLRRYAEVEFEGASSHSGRRTFITNAARRINEAGGSLRDVQDLAGHSSLTITQRYIEANNVAKRRVVNLL